MKIILLLPLLALVALNAYTQEDIRTNILSYADSTEFIIRNGRNLIVDKILSGQHKEAQAALNYLKESSDRRYVILYPVEELLFSLATRNFPLFLYNAKNFSSLLEGKTRAVTDKSIVPEIQGYLYNEMPFIIEDLDNYSLNEEDKELIRIYIRYYMNDAMTDLNKTIRHYQKKYPETGYSFFLSEMKKLTTTARMNFVLGYGNELLDGQISETFGNRLHVMNMEMDGFINQLYLSVLIGGSISPIYSRIDLPVKDKNLLHTKEEKISSLKYGMKIGRKIYSSQKFNLYPFISLGGYEMNSQSSFFEDKDSSNPKNNLTGSIYAGFGAASDIMLKKWESKSIFSPPGSLFLRLQSGYDRFFSQKEHTNGNNYYFMASLGISLGRFY